MLTHRIKVSYLSRDGYCVPCNFLMHGLIIHLGNRERTFEGKNRKGQIQGARIKYKLAVRGVEWGVYGVASQSKSLAISMSPERKMKAERFRNREEGSLRCYSAPRSFSRLTRRQSQLLSFQEIGLGAGGEWKSFGKKLLLGTQ